MQCPCQAGVAEALDPDHAQGMQRLDLVFVHLKRGAPIVGEMVSRGEGDIALHVLYGPRNKVGHMIRVPVEALKPYKVTSHQLKGVFPNGTMPEELVEKGEAYLITDKPTMYPDFSGYNPTSRTADQTGGANQNDVTGASPTQDRNAALAQDILGAEKQADTPYGQSQGFPMTYGLRRRYGNAGV